MKRLPRKKVKQRTQPPQQTPPKNSMINIYLARRWALAWFASFFTGAFLLADRDDLGWYFAIEPEIIGAVGGTLIAGSFVCVVNWIRSSRCPHCRKALDGRMHWVGSFCANCGKRIGW